MVGGLCVWIGNPLFDMMSRMMFNSSLYSSFCRWYVFGLLCRNLMAAYLCWAGWFEEYGIIVSVKVGFLYTEIFQLVGVMWIVMFRKFNLLLDSVSAVNFMFGWIVLKLFCLLLMSVWLQLYIIRISSTYWKYLTILCLFERSVRWVSSRFWIKTLLLCLRLEHPWLVHLVELVFCLCWRNSFF